MRIWAFRGTEGSVRETLRSLWRGMVVVIEVVGAVLFGVPLGLFIGICGGLLIYLFVFRILGQEVVAMWRRRREARLIASAPIRKVQPPRVPVMESPCVCGTVFEINGPCLAMTHRAQSSRPD